jgi:predicted ATPase
MSLVRRGTRHARADEDRKRLRSLYASFTEGLYTTDLRDARALLQELAT